MRQALLVPKAADASGGLQEMRQALLAPGAADAKMKMKSTKMKSAGQPMRTMSRFVSFRLASSRYVSFFVSRFSFHLSL